MIKGIYNSEGMLMEYKKYFDSTVEYDDFDTFLNEKSYEIIKKSNIFDEKYYYENYPDVKELKIDPITHYLQFGFLENCNPNASFKTKEYVKKHGNELRGLNPLVHYILNYYGDLVGGINNKLNENKISLKNYFDIVNVLDNGISIVIPIFNAYEDTKKCIESVLENTTIKFQLILINDCSTDLRINHLLKSYEKYPNITVIHNQVNQGFTKNVNMGIQQSETDVILLNSDTIVTPRWVQKIIISAYSDEKIGTLTPISNASDISVPVMGINNKIPSFLNTNEMSLLVEKVSANGNLVAPTGNGFCLFIKRDLIKDIGLFDEEHFGKGYGEETDFTLRAKKNGWKNVRNDSIFIYHKRSASFTSDKANALKEKHKSILLKRYPKMFIEWGEFIESQELADSVQNVKNAIDNFDDNLIKENVLYLTSEENGFPVVDDIDKLYEKYNIFILTLNDSTLKLWVFKNEFVLIREIQFDLELQNIEKINNFYLELFRILNIGVFFIQFNNSFKFLKNSPFISPLILASKLGLKVKYGSMSHELINPLVINKENKNILLDNIISDKDRGVVYTAIFGDYEDLLEPQFINPDLDYICFTDNPNLKSDIWDIKIISNIKLDDVRKARTLKILPHNFLKDYDYSIWVDAGFQIIGDIKEYINTYSFGKPMLAIMHSDRNCVYDEARTCIRSKKDNEILITKQIDQYQKEGYPKNNGLVESGILFRRHNDPQLIKVMEDWYSEIINFSNRDQISLPYVLWKNNFEIDQCRVFPWKNTYFEHFFHQKLDSEKHINVVDSEENIHAFVINENDIGTKKTIKSLERYNFISKSIVDFRKNPNINLDIEEKFILILRSGDLITPELIEYISNFFDKNLTNVGAITFDSRDYDMDDLSEIYKPNFSLDLYLEHDYIKNAVLINKEALKSINNLDNSYHKNYIRECLIQIHENGYKILKEDFIGFKLDNFNSSGYEDTDEIFINKYVEDHNISATIDKKNNYKLRYDTKNKKASIIIPFKDQSPVTEKCICSILDKTEYKNYEIILVNNNSYESETYDFINKYKNHEKIQIIDYEDKFNYSKLNNYATKYATGDVFVFLNNDTEVISEDWLSLLIGDAIQEDIGAVGAKLYYPDNTIQHTGVVIGLNGLAGHLLSGEKDEDIPQLYNQYRRNVSAVTGACMAIEKEVFDKINGFDELFDITGSDVEICLRLLNYGYRNVINPDINLIHYEKKTRSRIRVRDIDIKLSIKYYGPYLKNGDPFLNSNFSLNSNKLILKERGEIPVFKEFLKDFNEKSSKQRDKLNNIFKMKTPLNCEISDAEVLIYDVTKEELDDNAILMNDFFKNPHLKLDVVMWFIPWYSHIFRGGIYTIFRIANHFSFSENTHNIFVLKVGIRRDLDDMVKEIKEAFPNLKFELIDLDKFGPISNLPKSDAAICTLWTSAYSLVKYNNCKAKFYLNQDYEPLFYDAGSVYGLIEETYRFNFIGLANTKGVSDKYDSYGNVVKYFTPAVDRNIYYPGSNNDSKKRVVFYGRPDNTRNGFILGIEALKMVKNYFGDSVEIFSAGAEFDLREYGLEGVITNLGLLGTIEEVANLYRECDVGLVFMFTPHPSYQPLEYMACGCATVTNINESNMWLLKDKENCILSEPTVSCVAENIINLLNDDHTRNNIIQNGIKTIDKYCWENELIDIVNFVKHPK